jgi:hypothetical protein
MNTKTVTKDEQATKIVIGPVRLSYVHVWEPYAMEGQTDKKYSASLIISKKDKPIIAQVKKAIDAAIQAGVSGKWAGKLPKNLWNPLQDGDTEKAEDEAYQNSFFISAKASTRPGIVDKDRKPIVDQADVYSGCFGYVSVTFYPFNKNGNTGVAAGLNHIMKTKNGDALGGRTTAEHDFADLEIEDADADDLM